MPLRTRTTVWACRLGRHGGRNRGTDGRASLLFLFDYSIISGRFGAMGDVLISCYLEWRITQGKVRLEDVT